MREGRAQRGGVSVVVGQAFSLRGAFSPAPDNAG
jgi:hypothetical protein